MAKEWAVCVRRQGGIRRYVYQKEGNAKRRMGLYGAEPWKYDPDGRKDPEGYGCCNGHMCGCCGMTNRELAAEIRKNVEGSEVWVEVREVDEWEMWSVPGVVQPIETDR